MVRALWSNTEQGGAGRGLRFSIRPLGRPCWKVTTERRLGGGGTVALISGEHPGLPEKEQGVEAGRGGRRLGGERAEGECGLLEGL